MVIIKTYRKDKSGFHGQDAASWNKSWSTNNFMAGALSAHKDHLSGFFKKYFPCPPEKILEGGCGTGKYVYAYRKLGYNIIGVDFATELIRRAKEDIDPTLPVYEADITQLPFDDGYFGCYYSGGVIEHFEEGPDRALKEARRVLKTGGLLLATVPYVNLIRKARYLIHPETHNGNVIQKKVSKCSVDDHPSEDRVFCEYAFDANSLVPYFKKSGFSVEKIYPTDILWGELGTILRRINKNKNELYSKDFSRTEVSEKKIRRESSLIRSIAYDFLVTENRDNMLLRLPISVLNHLSGHMALCIARAL